MSLRPKPFIWKRVPPTGSFSCKSNSFSLERFGTKTRFNSEMAYWLSVQHRGSCNWTSFWAYHLYSRGGSFSGGAWTIYRSNTPHLAPHEFVRRLYVIDYNACWFTGEPLCSYQVKPLTYKTCFSGTCRPYYSNAYQVNVVHHQILESVFINSRALVKVVIHQLVSKLELYFFIFFFFFLFSVLFLVFFFFIFYISTCFMALWEIKTENQTK